jgi:thiol-disulfide isomerase/thioredoxin
VRGTTLRWVVVAAVVVAAVVVAVWPRGHANAPAAAAPAPNLTAARGKADLAPCVTDPGQATSLAVSVTCMADGKPVDLGDLVSGGPALVNVWASWCQPCQQELPALDSYAASPGAIRVVGVQVQSPQSDGLSLLAGLRVRHFPMVYDTGAAARALRLPVGLPVSYLVGPDGSTTVITQPARVLATVAQVRAAVTHYLGGSR